MKANNPYRRRLLVIAGFLALVLIFYGVLLFQYQVVHGSEYRAQSMSSNATAQTVEASRGIIQ